MTTQKEISLKIIDTLHWFFQEERGQEFTLFFWSYKDISKVRLSIKFTYKILEGQSLIIGSSSYPFIKIKNFKSLYNGLDNSHDLSKEIVVRLSHPETQEYQMTHDDFPQNFSILTGVIFNKESLNECLNRFFPLFYLEAYKSKQRAEDLEKFLNKNEKQEKIIKI